MLKSISIYQVVLTFLEGGRFFPDMIEFACFNFTLVLSYTFCSCHKQWSIWIKTYWPFCGLNHNCMVTL